MGVCGLDPSRVGRNKPSALRRIGADATGIGHAELVGLNALCEAQQITATLRGDIDRKMVIANRSGRTGSEDGTYGGDGVLGFIPLSPTYLDR